MYVIQGCLIAVLHFCLCLQFAELPISAHLSVATKRNLVGFLMMLLSVIRRAWAIVYVDIFSYFVS